MSQQEQPSDSADSAPSQQQQQPQPPGEHHAGSGADSAMKQMRIWEQRRASSRNGRSRDKPGSD